MKKTITTLSMAALLMMGAASCKKEQQDTTRFTATMEQSDAKAALANFIAWSSGDQIGVFSTLATPTQYNLDSACAGTVSGTFSAADPANPVESSSTYYAVYPYNGSYTISGNEISGLALSATQTAVANTFPAGTCLMVSQTSTQNLSFKNVCAYIKVTPVESCTSITVAAAGQKLACSGGETFSVNAGTGEVDAVPATGSATVTLSGTINAGKSYLIAVLPVTNADITVTYNTAAAGAITRTYTNKTIARGDLVNLGVELSYGHEYVDLGLPSGLKWATCNVGAATATDYGDYFAWGETKPLYKSIANPTSSSPTVTWKSGMSSAGYSWTNYSLCDGTENNMNKYNDTDNKTVLDMADDAARANWGGSWRMPTQAEMIELLNNTDAEWATLNGVYGRKFKNRADATKFIFLPAAGYFRGTSRSEAGIHGAYWSATRDSGHANSAPHLYFRSSYQFQYVDIFGRRYGFTVRPVCE